MKSRRWGLALLFIGLGVVAVFGGWAARSARFPLTRVAPAPGNVRGVVHVHTKASHDGHGTVEDVALAASRAGLSFVIVSEHNARELPAPRYLHGVLLIHASELSTENGHLLALGIGKPIGEGARGQSPFESVAKAGGKAVLAHPLQRKNPWRDWAHAGAADGYEHYSGDSFFRNALIEPGRLACALSTVWFDRTHAAMALVQPLKEDEGQRLLSLPPTRERFVLCAQDAHGLPPYDWVFPLMSMHLKVPALPQEPEAAQRQVFQELFQRRALCVFDALGDATGFSLEGLSPDGTVALGQEIKVHLPETGGAQVRVHPSVGGRLLEDGRTVLAEQEGLLSIEVQMRVPLCGLWDEWKPWILPNPVKVQRIVDSAKETSFAN
jgi:hypothetical protein